jgi:uncharacterized protein YxeA
MKKALLIILVLLAVSVALLYSFNNCTEGGIAGNLNKCDCVGIKVKKTSTNYPDTFEEYTCIGLIK